MFKRIDTPGPNCREWRVLANAYGFGRLHAPYLGGCGGERFKGPCVWKKVWRVTRAQVREVGGDPRAHI